MYTAIHIYIHTVELPNKRRRFRENTMKIMPIK